jgi:heterodisulfide reductase subunit A2
MSQQQAVKPIQEKPRLGIFLCECGERIVPKVDVAVLTQLLQDPPGAAHVEVLPYSCLRPGLDRIKEVVNGQGLNRLIIAGCESRILHKKFEQALEGLGLSETQIDMVNLRDHVAQVHSAKPAELAQKGAKLIRASQAWLEALEPVPRMQIAYQGPVMVLGGGVAAYGAAQELAAEGMETLLPLSYDPAEEMQRAQELYLGEYHYYPHLEQIIQEVEASPLVNQTRVGALQQVSGKFGDYTVTFAAPEGEGTVEFKAGAIIAALDWKIEHQLKDLGHGRDRIICQVDINEMIRAGTPLKGRIIFWVDDLDAGQPFAAPLSLKSAWTTATYIRETYPETQVSILYDNTMPRPLGTFDRARARELGIALVPYDNHVHPTVKTDFISYNRATDRTEQDVPWDLLVLSPRRVPGEESLKTAKILGLEVKEEAFLDRSPQMVRPDHVVLGEKLIVGSACQPCDLRGALSQGARVAKKTAALVKKAQAGELFAPQIISRVDQSKCTVCTLCREICDCMAIQPVSGPVEGLGHNVPRMVDPMLCTGEGTCAASCPELALTLANCTTAQHEARAAALARRLDIDEVMGFGCQWSGAAVADQTGLRKLRYDRRFYLLPVRCLGQIDPMVMGRAFLEGANGLLLVGCNPEECHHSYGIDHTWSRVWVLKKLLSLCGLERERIALAHSDIIQPEQFVKTVDSFMKTMAGLGPINRQAEMQCKLQALNDALKVSRVRWVLGVSLRRPWETTYPSHMTNPAAYDRTLTEILTEEFFRARVKNLMKQKGKLLQLADITKALAVDEAQAHEYLKDMGYEGQIAISFVNRTRFYGLPSGP